MELDKKATVKTAPTFKNEKVSFEFLYTKQLSILILILKIALKINILFEDLEAQLKEVKKDGTNEGREGNQKGGVYDDEVW